MSDETRFPFDPNKLRILGVCLSLANAITGLCLLGAWVYLWLFVDTGPNNKSLMMRAAFDVGKILLIVQLLSLIAVIFIAAKGHFKRWLKFICILLAILGVVPTISFHLILIIRY
ncbi:MAG: hypothetical protein ACYSW4_02000 [Planctomycetota bacterium]|jgi:hypothetical protein